MKRKKKKREKSEAATTTVRGSKWIDLYIQKTLKRLSKFCL